VKIQLMPSTGSIEAVIKHSEICTLDRESNVRYWMVEDPRSLGRAFRRFFLTIIFVRTSLI